MSESQSLEIGIELTAFMLLSLSSQEIHRVSIHIMNVTFSLLKMGIEWNINFFFFCISRVGTVQYALIYIQRSWMLLLLTTKHQTIGDCTRVSRFIAQV